MHTNGLTATMVSVALVSLVSFVGAAMLPLSSKRFDTLKWLLIALAVGAMLGDAFLHLIPEGFERAAIRPWVGLLVVAGYTVFFLFEALFRAREREDMAVKPVGVMNLIADGIHNAMDGLAIGVAFQLGPTVGAATTIAIVLHEIPQEMGDFAILIHAGFTKRRALAWNFASALAAFLGAGVAFVMGSAETTAAWLSPVVAGGFIYIGASAMVPEIVRARRSPLSGLLDIAMIALGVGCMWVLAVRE